MLTRQFLQSSSFKRNLRIVVLIARDQHLINLYMKYYYENSEVFVKAQDKLNKYINEKDVYL